MSATTVSVPRPGLTAQAAEWLPPHRGRTGWLVVVQLCVHCLGGHRHVVDGTTAKTLTKTCPVTGTSYTLAVPRAVRRG
jgi:hypothetical protein